MVRSGLGHPPCAPAPGCMGRPALASSVVWLALIAVCLNPGSRFGHLWALRPAQPGRQEAQRHKFSAQCPLSTPGSPGTLGQVRGSPGMGGSKTERGSQQRFHGRPVGGEPRPPEPSEACSPGGLRLWEGHPPYPRSPQLMPAPGMGNSQAFLAYDRERRSW